MDKTDSMKNARLCKNQYLSWRLGRESRVCKRPRGDGKGKWKTAKCLTFDCFDIVFPRFTYACRKVWTAKEVLTPKTRPKFKSRPATL